MTDLLAEMIKKRKSLTPTSGVNIIGYDSFVLPPDNVFLIKHCDSMEEAQKFAIELDEDYIILEADK